MLHLKLGNYFSDKKLKVKEFLVKLKNEAKKSAQINDLQVTLNEKYFLPEYM
jgi:hypothetical protein